ncbi:hypothetical protein RF11_10368 [Thelohanellus kitauei]|uniref:Uncharacterized protein n=1 Tax=Thelohanellus kitauei TaxID=669202 RepID=A0A0C2MV84_THEKT|nr:hypothetical protein RF11_10368 [Thelohanellus kitauei]
MSITAISKILDLTIIAELLGSSEQQIFRISLPIGDSSFILKSATMTGCDKSDCQHFNSHIQTLNMTFIPFSRTHTVMLDIWSCTPYSLENSSFVDTVDVCLQDGIICPMYEAVIY